MTKKNAKPDGRFTGAPVELRRDCELGQEGAWAAPRNPRTHYRGGGLWACFESFAKFLRGGRKVSA